MADRHGDHEWYGARTVFRMLDEEPPCFEERVTLWLARSLDEALELAEAEALDYADAGAGLAEYTGLLQVYRTEIRPDGLGPGAEVFSLVRNSPLASEEYVDQFFDTGEERQLAVE